jgi:hypothetical protein
MGHHPALSLLLAAALASSSARPAAGADPDSDAVLKRAVAKVVAHFESFSSSACLETIQREYFQPRAATLPRDCPVLMEQRQHPTLDMELLLSYRDRLRLEVTTSSRGEIHSWPGASRFSDSGIETLVRQGPIGTGAFGVLMKLIFVQDVKGFAPAGEVTMDGRRCFVYNFAVPVAESHYRVRSQDDASWLTVGYDGVVYVDAEIAEPVRVTVQTNHVPLAAGVCLTASTLQFKHNEDAEEFLLPVVAGQRFIGTTGMETQNTITFSGCRQYSSESSVTFYAGPDDAPAPPLRAARAAPTQLSISELLPFSMELLTPIDSDTTAGGDRFRARLTAPLRDGKQQIAPKGAIIEGRVSDVAVEFRPVEAVSIGLIPDSLQIEGSTVPFAARLDLRSDAVAREKRQQKGLQFFLPAPGEYPHRFRFPGTHKILPKGFVSAWWTARPRQRN